MKLHGKIESINYRDGEDGTPFVVVHVLSYLPANHSFITFRRDLLEQALGTPAVVGDLVSIDLAFGHK